VTISYTLEQLHKMELAQLAKEQGKTPDPDSWRWSPLDIHEFNEMLTVAHQLAVESAIKVAEPLRQLSIVEAGSGIGTKLWWAKNKFNMIETGYENNDEYLVMSARLEVNAYKHDLSDLDNQPVWSAYDVVYIARPFKDDMFEVQWEKRVHDDMRPGAVLISAFAAVKPYNWTCFYRRPFRGVWVKPEPNDWDRAPMQAQVTIR
jgi:hypothetical protein